MTWLVGDQYTKPSCRLICFNGAGGDPQIFLSKCNNGPLKNNVLREFTEANKIDFLCVHLPGRTSRFKNSAVNTMDEIILETFHSIEELTDSKVPTIIFGHSMGAWCAFELANLLKKHSYPIKRLIFSCMISPNSVLRPWTPHKFLNSLEFQQECITWGMNPRATKPEIWQFYEPILRSDFHVLDTYEFDNDNYDSSKLDIPTTIIFASEDKKIINNSTNVDQWRNLLYSNQSNKLDIIDVKGNHNYMQDVECKNIWMKHMINILEYELSLILR